MFKYFKLIKLVLDFHFFLLSAIILRTRKANFVLVPHVIQRISPVTPKLHHTKTIPQTPKEKKNASFGRAIYVWKRQNFCSRFSTKRNLMGFLVLFVTPCRLISLKLFPYQYENCLFMMLRDIAIWCFLHVFVSIRCLQTFFSLFLVGSFSRLKFMWHLITMLFFSSRRWFRGDDLVGFDCLVMYSGSDWKINYACLMWWRILTKHSRATTSSRYRVSKTQH